MDAVFKVKYERTERSGKESFVTMNGRPRYFIIGICVWVCLMFGHAMAQASEGAEREKRKLTIVQENYRQAKKRFPGIADIDPEEAQALLASGRAVFIDVREREEQAVSMIKDALSVSLFLNNPNVIEGKTAVVYCTIGYRSGLLARQLARHGIHVRNLAGGMLAWTLTGGTLYDAGKETKRIHVYGNRWRLAPEGYESVF
jgi:rhodanese-related sulfurtransferase